VPAATAGERSAATSARSAATCARSSASSTISPLAPPPPVWTCSEWTPNARWIGPCSTSSDWTRPSGTSVSLIETSPLRRWIPSSLTHQVVVRQRR
jgi:hypothetical protein